MIVALSRNFVCPVPDLRLDTDACPRYAARPMTVTDIEIGHARPVRSPDTKAAIKYLEASGATAITIVEIDGVCSFHVGSKIDPHAVSVQWLPAAKARSIAMKARNLAGANPDAATAARVLAQAAADQRVTLTPNDVAMSRAGEAAGRLDAYVEALRARGDMKEFTKAYRLLRMAAKARGEGFMSFKVAELRLRRALIPYLVGGNTLGVRSLFAEVFGD
jgi:hypothetical protein